MNEAQNQQDTPGAVPAPRTSSSLVEIDIKEKEIIFVLPQECSITGSTTNLTGGAYIQGDFSGTLICAKGALVIAKGASFSGYAEADEIYIAGEIGRTKANKASSLVGRLMIAVSEDAVVHGDLTSRMFNINSKNIFGQMRTLA